MQLDWDKAINEILSEKMTCQACGATGRRDDRRLHARSLRRRVRDALQRMRRQDRLRRAQARRRLRSRARAQHRVNGEVMDEAGMMGVLLDECRRNLEDSIDYLATYWKEEIEVDYDDMAEGARRSRPGAFQGRRRVAFAARRGVPPAPPLVPRAPCAHPGSRGGAANYVEEVIGLGYTTLLGD